MSRSELRPEAASIGADTGTYDSSVELRVLGAVEVLKDGAPARLGGPKQRTVLALLGAELGRTVSTDRLIDALWGDDPPGRARHTLQTYISNLRSALGDVVMRDGAGYRLDLGRAQVDAARFEDEVAAAGRVLADQPQEAERRLRDALALWRGHPYADQAGVMLLDQEARRLEELRLKAVEDRIEAELALGLHSLVVGELEGLTAEFPLRERFRAQHMLGLYRSGRQAEALRSYEKTRIYLGEELGIDPSTELRELEQRILEHDPTLDLPAERRVETLAFLFADLEDPVIWEAFLDGEPYAIQSYEQILLDAIETAGGHVFQNEGTGFCASFPEVRGAVKGAQQAQLALAGLASEELAPPKMRMAIDCGEVESRAGGFSGPPLIRCGRLVAAAHGGQVLLSADAHTVLSEKAIVGWQARALGDHRFKGLGQPQPVFQLVVDGLPAEFPALVVDRPPVLPGMDSARTVRGYEFRERVGSGDFGVVYRAYQPSIGREVALKVVRPGLINRPAFVRLFEAEAQLVASLEHPHIVALYDYWRDPDGAYLVMRWMRSGSLRRALDRGPWNLEPALHLLTQIGGALAYAHRRGVVHRDLKPSNVLLDEEGNGYLSDFGIAHRFTDVASVSVRPQTSSPAYLVPEELRGEPLRITSDIYSLGLLTFEILAGRPPPMDGPLPSMTTIRPEIPDEVTDVIARATHDDPVVRFPSIEEFLAALASAVGARSATSDISFTPSRNPYKGLNAFGERDAPDFFGRDAVIADLVQAVRAHRLVAVVGPSGIGKSSLVKAGLIPALRAGAIEGSQEWLVTDQFPGSYPFEELESALLRVAVERPPRLADDLRQDERGLIRATKQILPPDAYLLLVIDQFEELFTLTANEDDRREFMGAIAGLASDQRSLVRVVITLRADFFDRPLRYPVFAELVRAGMVVVPAPDEQSLVDAVRRPAEGVGVRFEPGLVPRIVAEVQEQPGALPLLQYALTELFATRTSDLLTVPGYQATGGVLGALGRRADELFDELGSSAREVARQIFLRLVHVQETAEDTRRRLPKRDLQGLNVDTQELDRVLGHFGEHRLLTFDRDPVTRAPTVEVAHEALLTEWARLREWIGERREDLLIHRRLAEAVAEWEASSRSAEFLFQGGRLDHFETWARASDLLLTNSEREFLEASRTKDDRRRRRLTRRRWSIVAALVAALVVISGLALSARNQAQVATARELVGAALANLEVDPELSILLALEVLTKAQSGTSSVAREAEEVLHWAITSSRIVATIPGAGSISDWSPAGDLFALAGGEDRGAVEVRGAGTGELLRVLEGDNVTVEDIAFSPDGSMLAIAGNGGVELWDPANGSSIQELDPNSDLSGLSFSADGRFLAGVVGSQAMIWDLSMGHSVGEIPLGRLFQRATALSPDGSQLAVARDLAADVYDVASGDLLWTLGGHVFNVTDVDWSPDGSRIVTSSLEGIVRVWDANSGELLSSLVGGETADWSSDGSRLVTGGDIWVIGPRGDGRLLMSLPVAGANLSDAALSPDATHLVTTHEDGTARVWDLGLSGDAELLNLEAQPDWNSDLTYSPDGRWLLGSVPESTVRIWDPVTGEEILTLQGHSHPGDDGGEGVTGIAVSPDGRLIATSGRDLTVRVWEAATGEEMFSFDGHTEWVEEVRFSPDGRLLATASLDGTARIIDVETGREFHLMRIASIPEVAFASPSVLFGPDGRSLVTSSWDGSVRIWDVESGAELRHIDTGARVDNIALDQGGTRVAVVAGEVASVWELSNGEQVATLVGHPAFAVAFSPDGRVAIGSHRDGLVRVWDPEDGSVLMLRGHSGGVTAVGFGPDGSQLASLGTEGTIRVWVMEVGDLIEIAKNELTRSFSDDECRQYLHMTECP